MDHQFDESYPFVFIGHAWKEVHVKYSDFRFKKNKIDDQIAEMVSLNFTAVELSLFSRKKQRSKKIKTPYNCIWDQILSGTPTEE